MAEREGGLDSVLCLFLIDKATNRGIFLMPRVRTILHSANEVRLLSEPLTEPIYWQGRQWVVTAYGIECRDGKYNIEARRLTEELRQEGPWSWVGQMGDKPEWVDLEDFGTAFFVACAIHGHKLRKEDVDLVLLHYKQAKAEAEEPI